VAAIPVPGQRPPSSAQRTAALAEKLKHLADRSSGGSAPISRGESAESARVMDWFESAQR